jgi:hypothetical protein
MLPGEVPHRIGTNIELNGVYDNNDVEILQ